MTAPLVGVTPIFALSFFGYDMGCKMQTPAGPNGSLSLLQYGIGGAVSGVFSTAIMGPGERIKCLLQEAAAGARVRGTG
ncbi:solute carrier family 25, member 46 [Fonticula alba]|uniref:Solute carrier family 25, member 46 n=1 Tax=Fonticula alba TaxID=691883 RepID=A0A058YZQ9_FONAL|nr:solute carrier family 25, member 46 [Fonticula alba]KCV67454.1 solute carrier family 25, member 46 [Fonticula alba]|eukprot:XP_009498130.1 solute carrier family 25, member 46 [Fonticula alba]